MHSMSVVPVHHVVSVHHILITNYLYTVDFFIFLLSYHRWALLLDNTIEGRNSSMFHKKVALLLKFH